MFNKTLIFLFALIFISGCTSYTRELHIYANDGGWLEIGDIEVLAEWKKGDEQLTNTPAISPTASIPISGF